MKRSLCALAILSIVSTATFAGVGKVYPGSMGVRRIATDAYPVYSASMIQNPSSIRQLRLDLPAIHDTTKKIKRAWVKVVDRSPTETVACRLHSQYRVGGSFFGFSSPTRISGGSTSSPQTLSFSGIGANSQSHYYFSCVVPRRFAGAMSGVVSYFIEEE